MSDKSFQFEQSLQQLSELVNQLDNDALSVEKSLQLYEQGMQVVRQCENYLQQSKSRIEQVHKGKDKLIERHKVAEKTDTEIHLDHSL